MIRDRFQALLASSDDADPQARDERESWAVSGDWDTQEPDAGDIEDWVTEYDENPLIHQPTDQFAGDVTEPGYRVNIPNEETPPNVPQGQTYGGDDLDEALEQWLGECAIVAGEFGRDFGDLLEDFVKDLRGRRGTGLVEHVYDDAEDPSRILGLRAFKAETVTAYTRPGKGILLRPDDDASDAEANSPGTTRVSGTRTPPKTKAGKTAAYVQFDDQFGTRERDEVRLAQDDVTKVANNPDTGGVFGKPDTAQVQDRAKGVRQQLKDLDTGLKGKMFGYWIAKVGSEQNPVEESKAKKLVKDMDLNDPNSKTAVPFQVDPDKFDGEVPDVENLLQYQIEYILSAMPTPLYRVGFAGDINRDITGEQREDYRDEVKTMRDRLESAFAGVIQAKANELMGGDLSTEPEAAPRVELAIEPEQDSSPLADEAFDATAFKELMQGLKAGAPGGAPEMILPPETIVEDILKMDPEDVDPGDLEGGGDVDESDPEVAEAMNQLESLAAD